MGRPVDRAKWRLWARSLRRFRNSGMRAAAWCRQEGLPLHLFYTWRRKLQSLAATESQAVAGGPTAGAARRAGETSRAAARGSNAAGSRLAGNSRPPTTLAGPRPKSGKRGASRHQVGLPDKAVACHVLCAATDAWGSEDSSMAHEAPGQDAAQRFLPVELLPPSWVELVLAHGVLVRIPAVAGHAIRTAIETAAGLAHQAPAQGRTRRPQPRSGCNF